MIKEINKSFLYPIAGFLSIATGLVIINSGLSVHSGEIFLWLLGIFGFLLIFPAILFAKSIRAIKLERELKNKTNIFSLILIVAFGILWVSLIVMAFLKDW